MTLRVHGRRQLKSPSGLRTRPTSWRVRQAVFDWLRDLVEGCRWLDVCCGVGTMGAEALGRGARYVVGVERARPACALTRHNWEKIKGPNQVARVLQGNAASVLRRLRGTTDFDVVYFDPPYDSDLYDTVLPLVPPLVAPGGVLIVEHDRRDLPGQVGALHLTDRRIYGDKGLSFYRRPHAD